MAAARVQVWEEAVTIPTYPAASPRKALFFWKTGHTREAAERCIRSQSQRKYQTTKKM